MIIKPKIEENYVTFVSFPRYDGETLPYRVFPFVSSHIYDPNLTDSENEEQFQIDQIMPIERPSPNYYTDYSEYYNYFNVSERNRKDPKKFIDPELIPMFNTTKELVRYLSDLSLEEVSIFPVYLDIKIMHIKNFDIFSTGLPEV